MSDDELKTELKNELRKIFQFDKSDLDFGIYGVMNQKREEIGQFIDKDLIKEVEKELKLTKEDEVNSLKENIEQIKKEMKKTLGENAVEDGELKDEFKDTPLGKEYLNAVKQLDEIEVSEYLEKEIFNHLINFFSRYYDEGDFISQRRIGKNESYAIPYSGEEVLLYWVNKYQYYLKTGEYFNKYIFKLNNLVVNFRVVKVEEEKNDIKSQEKKFFVLSSEKQFDFDEKKNELNVYFEYRRLTEEEENKYKEGNSVSQDKINEEIAKTLEEKVKGNTFKQLFEKKGEKTVLEEYLNKYSKRNTTNYFIHKDLKGFLERELDFYIKNEVLQLEDLQLLGKEDIITEAKVFRNIALKIINFLAQIEDFQKKLWEKKKFVISTEYVITLDKIEKYAGKQFLESILPEILENKEQLEEWNNLFSFDIKDKNDLIIKNQSDENKWKKLPIDTKYFGEEFKWKLIVALTKNEDLDNILDGVLIKSDNWQALNLLSEKYRESVKTIYIDPPYNTGSDGFLYKDRYQHSSWMTMMDDRLRLARDLLGSDGVIFISIDDNEFSNLQILCNYIFPYFISNLIWQTKKGGGQAQKLYLGHEYVLVFSKSQKISLTMLNANYEKHLISINKGKTKNYIFKNGKWYFINDDIIRKVHGKYKKGEERRLEYEDIEKYKGEKKKKEVDEKLKSGEYILVPSKNPNKHYVAELKPIDYRQNIYSIIQGYLSEKAKEEYYNLFGIEPSQEEYYKPMGLVKFLVNTTNYKNSIILDFFAGSGTTAHAVMKLNKEDGGNRKFILVEMADYFNTIIIPRIKKVAYTFNWKDGKPEDMDGLGVFFKYQTLEQYEDSLESIEFNGQPTKTLLDLPDYFSEHMLDWETKNNETMFNEIIKDPFSYKLKIIDNYQQKTVNADLIETFNYLLGLNASKYKIVNYNNRKYIFVFGNKKDERIAIVWRSIEDINLENDKEIIKKNVEEFKPEKIYINGDYVENFVQTESTFRKLMLGKDE